MRCARQRWRAAGGKQISHLRTTSRDKGVVVTGIDPNRQAAEQGVETSDVNLDVGGKAVANAGDVRKALIQAKDQGEQDVLTDP